MARNGIESREGRGESVGEEYPQRRRGSSSPEVEELCASAGTQPGLAHHANLNHIGEGKIGQYLL